MKTLAPLAAFALLCALMGAIEVPARFMLPLAIVTLGIIAWMREEKY